MLCRGCWYWVMEYYAQAASSCLNTAATQWSLLWLDGNMLC